MTLRWPARKAAVLGAALLVLAASVPGGALDPAQAQRPVDLRFGVVEAHDAPAWAAELGAAWGRARFHWALVQPNGPGEWVEAGLTDAALEREQRAGREVIGLLIGVPEWARDARGLPRGLYLPPDDPGNLWAGFVRRAVVRYAGRIDHWIVWNEPDVWDASHPAFTWPGSVDDFVRLLKVAYLTAKAANPHAVIHLAAVSHWWDVEYGRDLYFPRLLDAILADPDAAANDYFYDVATLHLYFNPTSVFELLEQYQSFQAERGLDKPFWLVETNAAPSSDPAWPVPDPTFRVSLLEQAAYMPQGIALALAAGAERVAIYKLVDTEGDYAANPEPFGLIRADGSPRPAFTTARVAFEMLAGAERVTWNERHIVSQVIVEKPDQLVRILWVRVPAAQVAEVPALAESAILVDMWGNASPLEPADGVYEILLYAGECQQTTGDYCMIGGPPVYLVEPLVPEAVAGDRLPGVLSYGRFEPESPPPGNARERLPGMWVWIGIVALVAALLEIGVWRCISHRLRRERE